ncbi:MAG: bifunctional diaminohydroxyphosphoribosylaminopyrimidine deaminase/5-amino-6-(5-phosphoribosylamino)uracil reductase RibD [Ghiorsea sp.]|nr:bifunctional diaminohydroxyphosphoribosylaminopyrimidine deaminase/5-amino-6-(5-phosphoribosylamino)uracil reductase RibD [Ghiorsea sp.]
MVCLEFALVTPYFKIAVVAVRLAMMKEKTLSDIHQHWMQLALNEALKAVGNTHPNPAVGAVIVRDGQVLGKGYTQPCGGHHAEVEALKRAGDVQGATLYVTLEPCASQGRTPACTAAIIPSGIVQVVIASSDPNPNMAGGADVLQQAGIDVILGVCKDEADVLNRPFFHYIKTNMPWLIAKAAISLDGKMATRTKHSQWISGAESRQHAHGVRALCDAIVVGVGTLVHDNPSLTVRDARMIGKPPLRVMLGKHAPKPWKDCKLLSDEAPSRFYITHDSEDAQAWRDLGMQVMLVEDYQAAFKHLAADGCLQVLLEGGGKLHAACLEYGISNELLLYQAPVLMGGVEALSFWHGEGVATMQDALHIKNIERVMLGQDMCIRGDIVYPS